MLILYLSLYFILYLSLPSGLFLFNVRPDLLLILVIFAALFNLKRSVYIVFFAGLFKDAASGSFFGLNIFCFALWALMVSELGKHLYKDNKAVFSLIVAIATIANYIIYIFLSSVLIKSSLPQAKFLFITMFTELAYNTLFSFFIFDLFKKAVRRYRTIF